MINKVGLKFLLLFYLIIALRFIRILKPSSLIFYMTLMHWELDKSFSPKFFANLWNSTILLNFSILVPK